MLLRLSMETGKKLEDFNISAALEAFFTSKHRRITPNTK